MNNHLLFKNKTIKSLVNMGVNGHLPLFDTSWINSINFDYKAINLSDSELRKAEKLLENLGKHKCLDRQKTVLFAMKNKDRELIIKAFLTIVEDKVLDLNTHLQ